MMDTKHIHSWMLVARYGVRSWGHWPWEDATLSCADCDELSDGYVNALTHVVAVPVSMS